MQKSLFRLGLASTCVLFFLFLTLFFWQDITYVGHFDLHGGCYDWVPQLVALHVGSDALIGFAYLFISIMLAIFAFRVRRDMPFRWVFLAFGCFIVACGCTHFMEIITTVLVPVYWLAGYVKVITAIASVGTALTLPPLFPQVRQVIADAKRSRQQGQEIAALYSQLKENYYALANAMPLLVWTGDAEGHSQFFNDAWQSYTGYTAEELIRSAGIHSYVYPDDQERIVALWRATIAEQKPFDTELRLRNKQGTYRWHLQRALPVGSPTRGWISTTMDIDRQKRVEQELREATARQDMFLSMTSHELKTPLTSLQLLVSFLRKQLKDDTFYSKSIITIDTQVQRLIRLVNELLDMSRIKQDYLPLSLSRFAVDTFAATVVETVQRTSKHVIELHSDTQAAIEADRDRIEQVLINILTNAIKYSPEAANVHVRVREDEDRHEVIFSVQDYSIGIAPELQAHVFDQYYRVIGPDSHKYSGLGIGLYVSSEIIKRHNGRIWVESEEGKGATFFFALPLCIATA